MHKKHKNTFCSKQCQAAYSVKKYHDNCAECGKDVTRTPGELKKNKSKNVFCSKSCSATFNNRLTPKRPPEGKCKTCGTAIRSSRKYCSKTCRDKERALRNKVKKSIKKNFPKEKNKKSTNSTVVIMTDEEEMIYDKASRSTAVVRWRIRMKQRAVEYKGGCCQCCGYKTCIKALAFHHIDPSMKDFAIGGKGITHGWDKMVIELDKCVMLCVNCHTETHAGLHPEYLKTN